jgi:hypothetical protein
LRVAKLRGSVQRCSVVLFAQLHARAAARGITHTFHTCIRCHLITWNRVLPLLRTKWFDTAWPDRDAPEMGVACAVRGAY